jgi:hypothetical protein
MPPRGPEAAIAKFLRDALARDDVGVPTLEVMARRAGLLGEHQRITHAKLFRAAKKTLGVRSRRAGFGARSHWLWQLPPQNKTSRKPEQMERLARQIEAVIRTVPGTTSAYAERVIGGYYLNVDPDRAQLARSILNRHGSSGVAAKIQAHVIVANSYRAGARVIVLNHFAKGLACSDMRRCCCCCYHGPPSRKSTSITRSPSGKNYRMMIAVRI